MTEDEVWQLVQKQKDMAGAPEADEGVCVMHDAKAIWVVIEKKGDKVAIELPPQFAAEMSVTLARMIGHIEAGCEGHEQHQPPKMGGPYKGGMN